MGEKKPGEELQEYLDHIQEIQDHQYVKGYWHGKDIPQYHESEIVKFSPVHRIILGCLIIAFGIYVWLRQMVSLFNWGDIFSIQYGEAWLGLGMTLLFGIPLIWIGIKELRTKRG